MQSAERLRRALRRLRRVEAVAGPQALIATAGCRAEDHAAGQGKGKSSK